MVHCLRLIRPDSHRSPDVPATFETKAQPTIRNGSERREAVSLAPNEARMTMMRRGNLPRWFNCKLTYLLSGQARCRFRAAEHAIHCEDGAATMPIRPLQLVVSLTVASFTALIVPRWFTFCV